MSRALDVFDAAAGGQPVLRQTDAAVAQVGADLLVLDAIEAVVLEQLGQALRALRRLRRARQQTVEQAVHHARKLGRGAAGGAELIEFSAPR